MKTKLKLIVTASALLLGSAAGFAAAKGHHRDPARKEALMKQFDVNSDGALDDAEKAAMKQAFAAKRAARAAEHFAAMDTNKDGALSLEEFKAGASQRHGRGMRQKP